MKSIKIHQPCGDCGSSDGLTINEDGSTKCYACDTFTPGKGGGAVPRQEEKPVGIIYYNGEFVAIPDRKIKEETARFYKVKTDNRGCIVYPLYDKEGNVVATKIRKSAKEKEFKVTGDFSKGCLFGQHQFGHGGKYITIVEGQDDAMAAYQMLGSKWPVVSVHSASSAVKDVVNSLDFLETYENIVICFDADEPGRKAAQAVAEKLSPGKAHIVSFNKFKDANDYLKANGAADFQTEWWNKKQFTPVGVISFADTWKYIEERSNTEIIPLPTAMPLLSGMLGGGLAKGEITVVGALTSIGKTTFVNNLLYGFLSESENKVGYLGLETTVGEVASGLIDLHAKKKLSEDEDLDDTKIAFDGIDWKDKLQIIDHQGSLELDDMMRKIRNTIVAFDLDVFILDPLQASLPDLNNDTVKYAMDAFLKLAKQTNVSFVIVSHMRKPDGSDPHKVSEYDLLGSSSINQIAFNTILLSRDKLGENDLIKSSTKIMLVKARRTGKTGEAGWLYYNASSGLLEQGEDPYDDLSGGFDV